MVDWLLIKEEYSSPPDDDIFIRKSSLSILGVLSRVRRGVNPKGGFIYYINPAVKFAFTFSLIIMLSLSGSFQYVLLSDAFILLMLSLLELKDIGRVSILAFFVTVFSAVILMPSALSGNWHNSLKLLLKITGSAVILNVLAQSTKWTSITRAMKIFHVPDIIILVLDMAIKYIIILGEFSIHMLDALRLRSVGRNDKKYQSLSNLLGCLFLKSIEMSELTYSAMECRGFSGKYSLYYKTHVHYRDFIYAGVNSALIAAFFLISN